jgi:nicotinamide phosphoribosyltransferase
MDTRLVAEAIFIKELITEKYPTGIISVVSDSFDFWSVLEYILPALKDVIMARKPDALGLNKLVIRPDSGNPVDIICGKASRYFNDMEEALAEINKEHYKQAEEDCEGAYNMGHDEYTTLVQVGEKFFELTTRFEYNRHDKTYYYIDNYGGAGETEAKEVQPRPEDVGAIEWLWQVFGGTVNDKGYRVLDEHIGLIYGDSITLQRQEKILAGLKAKGFSSDNVVFGVGSYT